MTTKTAFDALTRELATEKHKLEEVFLHSAGPMVLFRGRELIIERFNAKYASLVPDRPLLGLPLVEAMPELKGTPLPSLIQEVFETGRPVFLAAQPVMVARADTGVLQQRFFDTSFTRILDAEGRPYGVLNHVIEVTESVADKAQIDRIIGDLVEERSLREQFVATLSHDLRTRLTAAKLSTESLKRNLHDPEKAAELAAQVEKSLRRADQMIRDLLDATRIRAGERLLLEVTACDLSTLVRNTVEEYTSLHGATVAVVAPPHVEGHWSCGAIQRIVENLCTNALKYGVAERPVTVTVRLFEERCELSVHNHGTPIPAADQATLFEPFRQTAANGGQAHGWGLGLTIVKGLVEAHGGKVALDSGLQGTTFTVTLPRDARPHALS